MKQITVSDLETSVQRYIMMAQEEDILILGGGVPVAKLVSAQGEKSAAWVEMKRMLKGVELPEDALDQARKERLLG